LWKPIKRRNGLHKFFLTLIAEEVKPSPLKEVPGFYWYPSIGNKGYPYTNWRYHRREYSWDTLSTVGEKYHQICRFLRERYKWGPAITDPLSIQRLLRIFDEAVEDMPKDPGLEDME